MAPVEGDPLRSSAGALRAHQDELLRRTLARCSERSPYYSSSWQRLGIDVSAIASLTDLAQLPLTTKSDFLADPDAFRLAPRADDVLWDVMYTTGSTSGQPAPVYATASDHLQHLDAARREGRFIGLSHQDTIANLLPLAPFPMGAYARSASDAASVGAAMVWCHTGRPGAGPRVHHSLDEAIDLVTSHRATVLWGIASFVRRFLLRCVERRVPLSSVRMALVTGEAITDGLRADLSGLMREAGAGASAVVNRYGATELGTSLYECAPGTGLHLLRPEDVHLEVVDAATARPVGDGVPGMLAFSHLDRTGTVLLRYLLGDITSLSHEPCSACGRTTPRLTTPPRRAAGLVKIKGTLVDLNALHESLAALEQLQDVQILVAHADPRDPFSPDVLQVRVAAASAPAGLREQISARTSELAHVSPEISFVAPGELFDPLTDPKARHVVDLRGPRA